MITLVTYADHTMTRSQLLCGESALKHGVDNVWANNPETIDKGFVRMNKEIFDQTRGCGYWLWKPWVIYNSLLQLPDNDILIYSDAGQEFVSSVKPAIDSMDGDIMLFSNGWPHVEWCKGSVIEKICSDTYSGSLNYLETNMDIRDKQCQASLQIYKVSQTSKDFVKEWLLYCQMPGMIDDSTSETNWPTFAEHRHDQAILTCIAYNYDIPLRWFPTLTNMHQQQPRDNYPAIINHHRKRNHEW